MKRKIQTVFLSTTIIIIALSPCVHAGIFDTAASWLSVGSQGKVTSGIESTANSTVGDLAGILFAIGVLIAIVATVILGIKFMTASASEQKAEVKKKAIIVAVGVFVLFASLLIWQVVIGALSSAT